MTATRIVELGNTSVTVRELTVAEVIDWYTEIGAVDQEQDAFSSDAGFVRHVLFEDMSYEELARLTDLTPDGMDALTQSEVRQVIDACKVLNPDFFAFRARLLRLGEMAMDRGAEPRLALDADSKH